MLMTYLITHSKPPVVGCRSPHLCDEADVCQVHDIEPAVQNKPPRLPMCGRKVGRGGAGECEAVDKEEAKDNNDARQDTPP
jgi:hypothetical protein